MTQQSDAYVVGSQEVTIGTQIVLSVDWSDAFEQTFTISSVVASLFEEDGTAVAAITGKSGTVTTGLLDRPRTDLILSSSETGNLTAGNYYMIYTLVLGGGQTRKPRQYLKVTNP